MIQDGKVSALGSECSHSGEAVAGTVLDVSGKYVAPGFIDLHVHGGGGADFMDAEQEALKTILSFHAAHGTTGLLATVLPASRGKARKVLEAINGCEDPGILGIHLEGPFVSAEKRGALNARWLRAPSSEIFDDLVDGQVDRIRMVTFAPELPDAASLLERIIAIGAVPSIGHTAAGFEQVMQMVAKGASHFTHVPNAMQGLHHREPGAVGAALDSEASIQLIADGVHVHPAFVRLLAKAKGYDQICLITDAIGIAGASEGQCFLGELEVHVREGVARLADGTLAGSTLSMAEAVKNFREFTRCSLPEAVGTASLIPARVLRIDNRKGSLGLGMDADIVVFDEGYDIHYTIVGGQAIYAPDNCG